MTEFEKILDGKDGSELLKFADHISGDERKINFQVVQAAQIKPPLKIDINNFAIDYNLKVSAPQKAVYEKTIPSKIYRFSDSAGKPYVDIMIDDKSGKAVAYIAVDPTKNNKLYEQIFRTNVIDTQAKDIDQKFVKLIRGDRKLSDLEKDIIIDQKIFEKNLEAKLKPGKNNMVMLLDEHYFSTLLLKQDMTRKHLADKHGFKAVLLEKPKNAKYTLKTIGNKTMGDLIDDKNIDLEVGSNMTTIRDNIIKERRNNTRNQHLYAIDYTKPEYQKYKFNFWPEHALAERDKFMAGEASTIQKNAGDILLICGVNHLPLQNQMLTLNSKLNIVSAFTNIMVIPKDKSSPDALIRYDYATKNKSLEYFHTISPSGFKELDKKTYEEITEMSKKLYDKKLEFEAQAAAAQEPHQNKKPPVKHR